MYNPVKRTEETDEIIYRGDSRKYYRFRPAKFYGGIATADCVGCNLRCLFCWSWHNIVKPGDVGFFCSPQLVAEKVLKIARKKHFRRIRISGNEPTIAREHLIKVLEQIPEQFLFILETNGILIGSEKTYAQDLARFKNLFVRVSLKGANEDEFSALTGAEPQGFELQIKAVENLYHAGIQVHPAVMIDFSPPHHIQALRKHLSKINRIFEDFEVERLAFYGDVKERLLKAKLACKTTFFDDIPV
jgi:uncharacterized Fe-S cluster-containing radical SAM superfamily protein